jgi:hypothetical protein
MKADQMVESMVELMEYQKVASMVVLMVGMLE